MIKTIFEFSCPFLHRTLTDQADSGDKHQGDGAHPNLKVSGRSVHRARTGSLRNILFVQYYAVLSLKLNMSKSYPKWFQEGIACWSYNTRALATAWTLASWCSSTLSGATLAPCTLWCDSLSSYHILCSAIRSLN